MKYMHLGATGPIPHWPENLPFKALVLVTQEMPADRRSALCRALFNAGCRFLMIHGVHCRAWDDFAHQVTDADDHRGTDTPDEEIVMTTWHERESLHDTLWFARHTAMHPCFALDDLWILDLSLTNRQREVQVAWRTICS